jgi:hypothetical protein
MESAGKGQRGCASCKIDKVPEAEMGITVGEVYEVEYRADTPPLALEMPDTVKLEKSRIERSRTEATLETASGLLIFRCHAISLVT